MKGAIKNLGQKMNIKILFRSSLSEESEADIASRFFKLEYSRMNIPANSLVIGRYSILPYYNELESDLKVINSNLINSKQEHLWIANCLEWSNDLDEYTPSVYSRISDLPESGPFVLKGLVNSRKSLWDTHMFAKTKKDAINVMNRLMDDSLISSQGIVIKKYVKLKNFTTSIGGLPVSNEWRTFWIRGLDSNGECCAIPLGNGFYFAKSYPEYNSSASLTKNGLNFATEVANKIVKGGYASFFSLDIGQVDSADEWIVIDINDGQMSGTCGVDTEEFYSNLLKNQDSIVNGFIKKTGWR